MPHFLENEKRSRDSNIAIMMQIDIIISQSRAAAHIIVALH